MNNLKSLIYFPQVSHSYHEYGIGIPLLDERVLKTFDYISNKFSFVKSSDPTTVELSINDFKLAHEDEFVEKILSDPDTVVKQTYELINEDGSYNRYDPSQAIRELSDFVDKALIHVKGTYLAARSSLDNNFCYHLGGGMHHAMSFRPGGFCMVNDIVISLRKLQSEKLVKEAIVIDMDAHKGDGTAQITKDDDSISTFSIHMENGWPLDKEDKSDPSFTASSCDVGVELEDDYLKIFKKKIVSFSSIKADIACVVHGADVYEKDGLESSSLIQLTKEQVLERDLFIYNHLKERGIPQFWVMAGGYGEHAHEIFTQFLDSVLGDYSS